MFILAADQIINEIGDFSTTDKIIQQAETLKLKTVTLSIDPLSAGWHTPIEANHFRSGNSPIAACEYARKLLNDDLADCIIVEGNDPLKSDYERLERQSMMEIYDDASLIQLYTQLAEKWCKKFNLSFDNFTMLAKKLFENYYQTFQHQTGLPRPDTRWFQFLTPLFRGVDCANPIIDYHGRLILGNQKAVQALGLNTTNLVGIKGVATQNIPEKNLTPAHIVAYQHLSLAYQSACKEANIDFAMLFKNNQALLEVYTCFPVVPLAFLLATKICHSVSDIPEIIKNYPLTITGGMNLAKGPWNNPVLRAMIEMNALLQKTNTPNIAGIHGNGGLGEKQGFLILGISA
jgi:hypothetical protein